MLEIALAIVTVGCFSCCCYLIREERRLLREIRRVAAMYPPYVSADAEIEVEGKTSVKINNDWSDELPGRD
jgi:hypothetical protein